MTTMANISEESLKEAIELKLLWLSHTLADSEKKALENCVMDLIIGNESADGARERIAFNKGVIWATEYIARRNTL